jgi:hypothetical protein
MIVDRSRRCRLDGAFQNPRFSSLFSSSIQQLSLSLSLSLSVLFSLWCVCVGDSHALSLSCSLSGVCVSVRRKKGEEEMKKGGERRIVREWGKERKEGESGREWAARGFWAAGP